VGTNFVNALARLGIPRMLQLIPRTSCAEATINAAARLCVNERQRCSAAVLATALALTNTAAAQTPIVVRGGWIFTATSDQVVRNRGILIRAASSRP
jgi:hypothetical protein